MAPEPFDQRANRRAPTMRDIADRVGVSRQLVSMVLRGVDGPSDESKERVLAASRELGYRPNLSARLLRQRSTRRIGMLFTMRNPFEVLVAEGLFARAAADGFGLVLGPTTDERSFEVVVGELLEARVEGVIGFNLPFDSDDVAEAAALVPFVQLGEWTPGRDRDNVYVDESGGLMLAVEHLVALGHRRIAYAGGAPHNLGRSREGSYRAAMEVAGLGDLVDVIPSDFTEEGGAAAARAMLRRAELPTAVIACGDQCATGLMGVLTRARVGVPEDVSVVGFDDSYLAALSYLRLTSVVQDVAQTVDGAWRLLHQRMTDPEGAPTLIATTAGLTVRDSTGPARR